MGSPNREGSLCLPEALGHSLSCRAGRGWNHFSMTLTRAGVLASCTCRLQAQSPVLRQVSAILPALGTTLVTVADL